MERALDSTLSTNRTAEGKLHETTLETAWIASSQAGDTMAFNRLVLKWEKAIYNLSLRMLQDPEEALESTQEVFLSAYKNIRRFRRDSKFSTWLYRIAVNHCISRLRRRPTGSHYSLDDAKEATPIYDKLRVQGSSEADLLREETRQRVRRALEHLHPDQRTVVELKFFQDLTFEEIAGLIRVPLSTIKSRLYTGLEVLKVRLGRSAFEV